MKFIPKSFSPFQGYFTAKMMVTIQTTKIKARKKKKDFFTFFIRCPFLNGYTVISGFKLRVVLP